MKVSIQPVSMFIPGKGSISANLLEVRVASYQLGVGATAFYDLQKRTIIPAVAAVLDDEGNETTPAVPEQVNDESLGFNGNVALTDEQFESWGTDDDWFARCIAQNLGLFPITNA